MAGDRPDRGGMSRPGRILDKQGEKGGSGADRKRRCQARAQSHGAACGRGGVQRIVRTAKRSSERHACSLEEGYFVSKGGNKDMRKRILSACMALCLMLTMLPVNALAADPTTTGDIGKNQATYSVGGLNITKTLTKEDGNLSLQLEAYVTGTVTPIETKPLDIVLVLDVSGSMDNTFTSETRYTYDLITGQSNRYIWWDSDNLYTLLEDGETYVPVEMSREPEYMDSYEEAVDWRDRNWTNETCYNYSDRYALYYYDSESGEYQTVTVERERTSLRNYQYTYFVDGDVIYTSGEDASSDRLPDWITFFVRQRSETYTYIYSYTGSDGQIVTVNAGGEDAVPSPADGEGTLNLYLRESDQVRTTKLQAMKDAVNAFIDEVSSSNGDHEIAVVKFADDSYAYDYWNGEYEIGDNRGTNQAQVVSDFSSDYSDLKTAVTGLHASGATAADYGLNLAQAVIDGDANLSGADPEYQKVVVFFTDGEPNHYNGFDATVAEDAVDAAYSLKQDGVTIYTVGVFSGANPEDTNGNFNRYMHGVSSNYPNAQSTSYGYGFVDLGTRAEGSNYYLAADSADALKDIFERIGGDITSSVDVDETAALTDTLTKYFGFGDLGFDSETGTYENVSVQVASATGENQWDAPTDASGVTVTVNGDAISVTGFDYAENAVVNNNGTWQGQKLVLTFPIEIDENADWGPSGYYDTNSAAGLKASDGTEIGMLTESPNVYVATRQVTYEFVSGTDGMDLPSTVTEQLTSATEYVPDTVQTPANSHAGDEYNLVEVTGTDNDGTWSPSADDSGVYQWTFDPDTNTFTLPWVFVSTSGGDVTETTDYKAGYFIILPDSIPDDFNPALGYSPSLYMPNQSKDTVDYDGDGDREHTVDNTTGYIGYLKEAGFTAFDTGANSNGRLQITTSQQAEDYLIVPEDYGATVENYLDNGYTIVWYQINDSGLSSRWPNIDPDNKTYQVEDETFHVDGYIANYPVTVTYNPNGGTGTSYVHDKIDGQNILTGSNYAVLSNSNENLGFTREGYIFNGWNTRADGTGTAYSEGSSIDPLMTEMILYAQWEEIVPSVDAGKDAELRNNGSIDYTITIKTGEGNQGILKNFRITDAKLPADVEDITIRINSAIPVYQEEIHDEDGTVTTPSGDPVVADQVVNDETVRVLTFALADPLDGDDVLTITYNYEYTDEDAAEGTVTNKANVEAWNEDEEQPGSDEVTTTTPVMPGIASVEKSVVMEDTLVPQSILDMIVGEITYPTRPTDTQENPQIAAEKGDKVTLLYEIGIVGSAGADFTVKEKSGADYVGAVDSSGQPVTVTFKSESEQYVGLIPEGCSYVTLYFTMTFEIGEETTVLTNAATVNDTPEEETVDVLKPGLNVEKTVQINGKPYKEGMVANENDKLTYTITVKNNSNAAITGTVTVTDDMWGSGDGKFSQVQYEWEMADADETVLSGTANVSTGSWQINPRGNDTEFAPGETWTFTYTYTVTAEDVIAGSVSNTVTAESGNGDESTDEVKVPAGSITITPANITIYTGGKGYKSVIGNEGATGVPSTGLPEPGYYIELPTALDAALKEALEVDERTTLDLSDYLTFLYDDGNGTTRTWKLERYDDKEGNTSQTSEGRYIYRILPDGTSGIAVRLQFTDGGEITTDDIFALSESNLYQTYSMTIYAGDLNQDLVQAVLDWPDDKDAPHHDVTVGSGELTVRGITDADGEATTTEIAETAPESEVNNVTAVIDADTKLYINESSLEVADTDSVELLVDSVVSTAVQDLKDSAVDQVSAITDDHEAQFYYLDLVDTDNGNTVVTTKNEPVTLFFPYPEGTDADTAFHIVHYVNQDRDESAKDEIAGVNEGSEKFAIEVYSEENQNLETTDQGIQITVTSFSPFGLFWEEDSGSSGGHTGGGGSSRPSRPTLNTEDHYSYIIGYSDGTLQPYGTITRGEVATIFFRLLTDDSREEWWSQVNDYSDCNSDLWCNNAISTLSNMGIIDGFSDGTFRPYAKITRAQFAKIAVGFFETTREDYQGYFTDVDIDAWYTEYVEAAARVGLIEGFNDGTFRPNTNITRAQACVIVNRALGRAPDEDRLLDEDEMITWPDNNPDDWFYADMQEATNSHDYTWTTVSGDKVENWTDKLPQRDWAALEHAWSTAHSAPGGEVTE